MVLLGDERRMVVHRNGKKPGLSVFSRTLKCPLPGSEKTKIVVLGELNNTLYVIYFFHITLANFTSRRREETSQGSKGEEQEGWGRYRRLFGDMFGNPQGPKRTFGVHVRTEVVYTVSRVSGRFYRLREYRVITILGLFFRED